MKRRLIGLAIGLAFGGLLGFFLMLMTGGGHGNFGWFVFFLMTSMLGLFYPAIGFLIADLRPMLVKSAFIALFLVHIFLVVLFFSEGMIAANASPRDLSFQQAPVMVVVLVALLSVPQISSIIYFVFYLTKRRSLQSE